jgi:hypothetical protein
LYDYDNFGTAEVINNAPDGSAPEPELYADLYAALFTNAIPNELRRPLPPSLKPAHRDAINDYLAYESKIQ